MAKVKNISDMVIGDFTDVKINAVKEEVIRWEPIWKINRAFRSGSHAVRALKTLVLPKLDPEQSEDDYAIYMDQAILYSAAAETADAWEGLIFQKDPVYLIDDRQATNIQMEKFNALTDTGMSATELLRVIVDEVIQVNRLGILLDYPLDFDASLSRKEQLDSGVFSNALVYKAESIINWHTEIVNGRKVLVLIVLKEAVDSFDSSLFSGTTSYQYRVLSLEETLDTVSGRRYRYRQRVYTEDNAVNGTKENTTYKLEADIYPTMDLGSGPVYIETIPFWLFNRSGNEELGVIKAPILDGITELNKGHFRNSADYENEIHKVSIKTPVIPGGVMEGSDLKMGSVIQTQYPDSRPYMLESGTTSPLAKEMKDKEERMMALGAKMLGQNNAQVTAETARIQAASEESVLGNLATMIADDFGELLAFKLKWDFGDEVKVSVQVNTDFWNNEISLTELVSSWTWVSSGGGSFDTYYNLLDRRNVYPKDWNIEKELERIKATQAMIGTNISTPRGNSTVNPATTIVDEEGTILSSRETAVIPQQENIPTK